VNAGEPERVEKLGQTLVEFLGQRGWEEEARQARKRLDGLARSGAVLSLAEIISLPDSEDVLRSVALAQEYIRRQKPYRAIEEMLYAIGQAPYYLPLHHMLGSFLQENGNVEAASYKFRTISRVYEIRGQDAQALATYQQILELSPLDTQVHNHIIELFIRRGQIDDALNQYILLADAYYQLADSERARQMYDEALKLAPRGSTTNNWEVQILHQMADLDMQRLDWQSAIRDYEKILRIAPDDERAHLGLIRLYPRTGRPQRGINMLDNLLKGYLKSRKAQKALSIMEELVQDAPENIALRGRIAQLSLNMGLRDKAMQHLDILGDLQLEAGDKEGAARTIETIISLNPPNADAYANLYREMTGKKPPQAH
jgi:tetratricopeptide (TPR) repeat protein